MKRHGKEIRSGKYYITIADLCVTTVPLKQDDLGGVGGSTTEKLTS